MKLVTLPNTPDCTDIRLKRNSYRHTNISHISQKIHLHGRLPSPTLVSKVFLYLRKLKFDIFNNLHRVLGKHILYLEQLYVEQ